MTNTQHTPGPWFVDINGEGAITAPDGMLIARMQNAYRDDLRESNARLIAAAPEMLAALIDAEDTMFRALESHKFDSPADSAAVIDTLVIVRAAIANALDQI